jgi:hypothetical protein
MTVTLEFGAINGTSCASGKSCLNGQCVDNPGSRTGNYSIKTVHVIEFTVFARINPLG